MTQIIDDIHFAWQAQYLVGVQCDFSWQAQHFVTFWDVAGARNVVFFNTKLLPKFARGRSPKRRVRDDDFIVDYPRIIVGLSSDYPRLSSIILESSFYWRKHFREVPLKSRFRGRRSIW